MKLTDIRLSKGQAVTALTGIEYTITKITPKRVWLTRPGLLTPQECPPELVKLWVARRG